MSSERKFMKFAIALMKNINFINLTIISVIMAYVIKQTVVEQTSSAFLDKISTLPIDYWKIPILVISLYFSLLCLLNLKGLNRSQFIMQIAAELILIVAISLIINFSYSGLFLLVLANVIQQLPKKYWKFSYFLGVAVAYIACDIIFLNLTAHLISFNTYLEYFQVNSQIFLKGVTNFLSTLNIIVFLVFMILSVKEQYSEKEHIIELNDQLNTANTELQVANDRLQEYSVELVKMTETRERNRLAREIHDTLGHALTGIITGIEACIALIDIAPEATKIQLKSISEVAHQGITDVRRSVSRLRPDSLEKLNLEKALIKVFTEMSTATNASIEYKFLTDINNFHNEEEDIIYRVIQESITNSIRHGKADKINVLIQRLDDNLEIRIDDNGIGCHEVTRGFGLHHMQERLNMLSGELSYSGDSGFHIQARFPIRASKND